MQHWLEFILGWKPVLATVFCVSAGYKLSESQNQITRALFLGFSSWVSNLEVQRLGLVSVCLWTAGNDLVLGVSCYFHRLCGLGTYYIWIGTYYIWMHHKSWEWEKCGPNGDPQIEKYWAMSMYYNFMLFPSNSNDQKSVYYFCFTWVVIAHIALQLT